MLITHHDIEHAYLTTHDPGLAVDAWTPADRIFRWHEHHCKYITGVKGLTDAKRLAEDPPAATCEGGAALLSMRQLTDNIYVIFPFDGHLRGCP